MSDSSPLCVQASFSGRDPLDDMEVSAPMERYFKVRAALAFLLRNDRSPEQVFRLYDLPMAEVQWFCQAHPEEAKRWVQAYFMTVQIQAAEKAAFFIAFASVLPIARRCRSFVSQY